MNCCAHLLYCTVSFRESRSYTRGCFCSEEKMTFVGNCHFKRETIAPVLRRAITAGFNYVSNRLILWQLCIDTETTP